MRYMYRDWFHAGKGRRERPIPPPSRIGITAVLVLAFVYYCLGFGLLMTLFDGDEITFANVIESGVVFAALMMCWHVFNVVRNLRERRAIETIRGSDPTT